MRESDRSAGSHDATLAETVSRIPAVPPDNAFTYRFDNFFHPFVGELIARLNRHGLPGMLDTAWQDGLRTPDPATDPEHDYFNVLYEPSRTGQVSVVHFPKQIDVSSHGAYANYNWELLFHIPLTVAVHLSKSQRFAEAQRWFHYIFDPTCNDAVPTPQRFWKFLAFRRPGHTRTIDEILRLLSTPRAELSAPEQLMQDEVVDGYNAIRNKPFQPHAVARTRHLAYQYSVVMKYLDNLIAWGDHLFQQDTVESINEATQRYVLAANLLGARPQRIPPSGTVRAKTFAQLKDQGLGPIGNALVELEGQFPFNLATPSPGTAESSDARALFGIGLTLYFCTPGNAKMLGYWDQVADRLFKIRHCMNIAGVVRPLALFDPPIDPGMLVRAAAAGVDVSGIVNGLNQPIGPVRSLALIQKALELCGEVRGLGGSLLAAVEKGDVEHLALVRQRHEVQIQGLAQEVRFLQWRSAQEATKSLLTTRATALERLRFYQRLLGLPAEPNAPDALALDRRELTEENFDAAYSALVGQFERTLTLQRLPALRLAGGNAPAQQSGAAGSGRLYLNVNEDAELNSHLPRARDTRLAASVSDSVAAVLTFIPDFDINLAFWGVGGSSRVFGGAKLHDAVKGAADILRMVSAWEQDQAGMASRTAAHERRADDWIQQYNNAAHELMQIGRQVLTSLVAEQIAHREYRNVQQQVANAQEVDQLLHDKFSNEELYLWMQGEISRLYYEYYRFAFDVARRAERTMKQELMRPELETQEFVKFNYWDGGRKGLLSGEALHLDVKRMEMAYHDNNKRELELTRHVSLRQLDPVALLALKAGGRCTVTIPEWLFDLDCPGHYMRRIKSVALSLPAVVGPYASVNCTLSLLGSSVRKSPLARDGAYARQGAEDERFTDYAGAVQSIVTSGASNDSGLFEANLRDERFLPFEGAGAQSTWRLELPDPLDFPTFDYATLSDAILHIRYTARQGVDPVLVRASLDELFARSPVHLALLFSLRHDFPSEWAAFVAGAEFSATILKGYFPYFAQGAARRIAITGFEVYDGNNLARHHAIGDPAAANAALTARQRFTISAGPSEVLARSAQAAPFLVVRYSF